MDRIKLKYLGGGSLHGVPARDLTEAEAGRYNPAALVASGLYALVNITEEQPGPDKAAILVIITEEQPGTEVAGQPGPEVAAKQEGSNDRRAKKVK